MRNRDEIIRQLYNTYRFIEEDISKFREIPCLSDVKDFRDGVKKLSRLVLQEVLNHGFVDTFIKIEKKVEIGNALNILYIMSAETGYVIKGADVIALANVEDYKECFDTFIKQNFIKDVDNLNKREIVNELLKNVLAARLNSDEIKKYRKEESEKQRKINRKSIYKSIPFSNEEIDRVISTLSPLEQDLIDKKEIGEKLSKEENAKIYRIKNKITDILKKQNKKEEKPTVSNEVTQEKPVQQEPPVDNNPQPIKEQKPVFSNVIEKVQSIQKLDNIVTGKEKQKDKIEERRVDENMSNENKYNIVVYKRVNAKHSLIDKIISELPEKEQKLIERKGRISLGVFDKLLTSVEEEEFDSIIKKIIHIVDPKAEIVEPKEEKKTPVKAAKPKKEKNEKSKTAKKRGKKPVSIYKLIPANKHLVEKYLNEKLDAEKLEIVNKREKLIREGRYDEIPKSYKSIIQGIVIPTRKRIMFLEEEINKLQKRKESQQQNKKGIIRKEIEDFLPSYSKEELNKLLEQLSDDDREIIQARREGKELSKPDLLRYYRVIHKLEKGIIPTPRKRRIKEELIIIETQEGKGTHPIHSIYKLIPIGMDILNRYIEEHLDEEEKNIVRTRERIISENSPERITQKAANKFARIIQNAREALIPEENLEEVYRKMRKGIRKSIYDELPFPKEEIDEEIVNLSDEEKKLIEKAESGEKLSKDERYKLRNITNKIERKINKKRRKAAKTPISRGSLYAELRQTINQNRENEEITQKTSSLLEGFDELVENEIKSKEETPEANIKEEIISKDEVQLPLVNQETKDFADYYRSLLSIAIKDSSIVKTVKMRDIAITCVRYGIGECNPSIDSETIAQFFGVSSEYVEQISSTVLKMLYDVIVKSIENTESPKIFQK